MNLFSKRTEVNLGRNILLVTCITFLMQVLAVPMHLVLEEHPWGPDSAVAHEDTGEAHLHHGFIVHLAGHDRNHHHHSHSGEDSGSGHTDHDSPSHAPHDQFVDDGSLEPARTDSSQFELPTVGQLTETVEIDSCDPCTGSLFDPPKLDSSSRNTLHPSRAPPSPIC